MVSTSAGISKFGKAHNVQPEPKAGKDWHERTWSAAMGARGAKGQEAGSGGMGWECVSMGSTSLAPLPWDLKAEFGPAKAIPSTFDLARMATQKNRTKIGTLRTQKKMEIAEEAPTQL
jgi:hypothetical protein